MICTNCGKEIQDGASFCPYCGALFADGLVRIHYEAQLESSAETLPVYNAETVRAAWDRQKATIGDDLSAKLDHMAETPSANAGDLNADGTASTLATDTASSANAGDLNADGAASTLVAGIASSANAGNFDTTGAASDSDSAPEGDAEEIVNTHAREDMDADFDTDFGDSFGDRDDASAKTAAVETSSEDEEDYDPAAEDEAILDEFYKKALRFEAEERRRREEEERKAREEAEARAEAERKAREEAERIAREEAAARAEAERLAREEAERKAREEEEARAEAERLAREEAERKAREEEEARAEAERKAQEEAEAQAKKDAERAELEEAMKQELLNLASHKTLGTHMFDEDEDEAETSEVAEPVEGTEEETESSEKTETVEDTVEATEEKTTDVETEEASEDTTEETESTEESDTSEDAAPIEEPEEVSEEEETEETSTEEVAESEETAEEAVAEEPETTEETESAEEIEETSEEDASETADESESTEASDDIAESEETEAVEETEEESTEETDEDSESETAEVIPIADHLPDDSDEFLDAEDSDDFDTDDSDDEDSDLDADDSEENSDASDSDASDADTSEHTATITPLNDFDRVDQMLGVTDDAASTADTTAADTSAARIRNPKLLVKVAVAVIAVVAVALAGWYQMPATKESRIRRQAEKAYAAADYTSAAAAYQQLFGYGVQSEEIYLHAADAYADAGHHAEAVALLKNSLADYPDSSALKDELEALNPTVHFDPEGGDFTDPVRVKLSTDAGDSILYTIQRDGDSAKPETIEYATPTELSYSGRYTVTAHAIARDGEAGSSFTQSYEIKLDPDKYRLNDWHETADGVQYLGEDGRFVTGWQTIDDQKYYFDEKGYRATGLTEIDRDSYFFNADGVMQTGWQQADDDWYFFDETGRMLTDVWIEDTYYVGADGRMLKDTTTPDGIAVDANGRKASDLVSLFQQYPKAMVVIQTADRQKTGDYSTFAAKAYYSHSSDTPEGDSTDVTVKISNRAWMHYIDKKLPDALVTDAYHFLPHIGILNPTFDDDGVITKFDFILGSQG